MIHQYSEFANHTVEAVAKGHIPWRLPAMPRNALSNGVYGGINPILLNITAADKGYTSPWWATAAQWDRLGYKVSTFSQKATRILLYKVTIRSTMEVERRLTRDFVYNWEQTDRSKALPQIPKLDQEEEFDRIVAGGKINIEYVAEKTCKYRVSEDRIIMPHRLMFEAGPGGLSGYYDAKGHEIFHWSERRTMWNSSAEARELRAEIGSGYLCGIFGITPLPRTLAKHHDAHASAWMSMMQTTPNLLFEICDNVQTTIDYLLRCGGRSIKWQTQEHNVIPCSTRQKSKT